MAGEDEEVRDTTYDDHGEGHIETVAEKLKRLGFSDKVSGISMDALKTAKISIDRDDVMSTAEATSKMDAIWNACVPEGHAKRTNTKFREAFEVAVIANGIRNGTSDRAPFNGWFKVDAESFKRETNKTALKHRVRQFYRYYADAARIYLLENATFRKANCIKWKFDETYDDLAFDFSDFCSGLTEKEETYIRRRKLMTTAAASNFDPIEDALQREYDILAEEARIARAGAAKPTERKATTLGKKKKTEAEEGPEEF